MSEPSVVGLIPSGKITSSLLEVLAAHIQGLLYLPVDILPPFDPPPGTYHTGRNQYHVGYLLDFLAAQQNSCRKVLGVASYDLFLPIFTHVYGEAQMSGKAAIFSIHRLEHISPSIERKEHSFSPHENFFLRAAKVGIHELLHTFGLSHCRHPDCLMGFVTRLENLDALPLYLCHSCRQFWEEVREI